MPCEMDDDECWEEWEAEFEDDWDLPDCDVDDQECWDA